MLEIIRSEPEPVLSYVRHVADINVISIIIFLFKFMFSIYCLLLTDQHVADGRLQPHHQAVRLVLYLLPLGTAQSRSVGHGVRARGGG